MASVKSSFRRSNITAEEMGNKVFFMPLQAYVCSEKDLDKLTRSGVSLHISEKGHLESPEHSGKSGYALALYR